jgi:hypothetical protein
VAPLDLIVSVYLCVSACLCVCGGIVWLICRCLSVACVPWLVSKDIRMSLVCPWCLSPLHHAPSCLQSHSLAHLQSLFATRYVDTLCMCLHHCRVHYSLTILIPLCREPQRRSPRTVPAGIPKPPGPFEAMREEGAGGRGGGGAGGRVFRFACEYKHSFPPVSVWARTESDHYGLGLVWEYPNAFGHSFVDGESSGGGDSEDACNWD